MRYNADFYIEKLLNHYNVSTISELAQILDTKQTSISSWRTRNAINAIKKKCRELGIYNEIFGDTSVAKSQNMDENIQEIENISNIYNLSAQNINSKLFLFPRRALVYLYYLIINESINNSVDYFSWMEKKEKTNSIINFISDFVMENNRLSLSSYRVETDKYLDCFITIEELDYIFKNKTTFTRSVKFMIDEK